MRGIALAFSILIAFVLGTSTIVVGQERTGDIDWIVNDQNNAAIIGADIEISGIDIGLKRNAKAGTDGSLKVVQLPPGRNRVAAKAAGFQLISTEVLVTLGQSATVRPETPTTRPDTCHNCDASENYNKYQIIKRTC